MAQSFSDDFNRADSDSLGSNWTERTGDLDIDTNQLDFDTLGGAFSWAEATWNTATDGDDQFAEMTGYIGAGSRMNVGFILRADTAKDDYYACFFYDGNSGSDSNKFYVFRFDSGSPSLVGNPVTSAGISSGDTLKVEAVTNGSQVDLKCYINDTLDTTVSDTNANRKTGADQRYLGVVGRIATNKADNFSAGDIGGSGTEDNDGRSAKLTGGLQSSDNRLSAAYGGDGRYVEDFTTTTYKDTGNTTASWDGDGTAEMQ